MLFWADCHPLMLRKSIIVVGAGTAGCVIAKHMSGSHDVTIIERSSSEVPLVNRIPLLIGLLYGSRNDFIHKLFLPAPCARVVPYFSPNVLGGASSINGAVHVLGNFRLWEQILSRFELTLENLKWSYSQLFTRVFQKDKIQICSGQPSYLDRLFYACLRSLGYTKIDTEQTSHVGFGPIFNTCSRIFRSSVLSLQPFSSHCVCTIKRTEITSLILDSTGTVVGVTDGTQNFLADIIILSCGVVGTNKILLNTAKQDSNKSSRSKFATAGIEIKDHTNLRVNVRSTKPLGSLNEINASFFSKSLMFVQHCLGLSTPMRGTGATSSLNLDIDKDGIVDTRINLLNFYESGRMGSSQRLLSSKEPGFSFSITQINPFSVGHLTLDQNDQARLSPGYLSDERDIEHLKKCIDFILLLLDQPPFKEIVGSIEDHMLLKSDPRKYILSNIHSGYHLIGGCQHLINPDFSFKGCSGLYICDASVMPYFPSSNIHSSVTILAHLFSAKLASLLNSK